MAKKKKRKTDKHMEYGVLWKDSISSMIGIYERELGGESDGNLKLDIINNIHSLLFTARCLFSSYLVMT